MNEELCCSRHMEYAVNLRLEQHMVVAHGMLQYSLWLATGTLDVIKPFSCLLIV